jgi:hypothetical protein
MDLLLGKAEVDKVVRARQGRDLASDRWVLTVRSEPVLNDAGIKRRGRLGIISVIGGIGRGGLSE